MRSHSGPEASEQSGVGWRRLWGLEKKAQGTKGRGVGGRSGPAQQQSSACCVTLGSALSFLGPVFLIRTAGVRRSSFLSAFALEAQQRSLGAPWSSSVNQCWQSFPRSSFSSEASSTRWRLCPSGTKCPHLLLLFPSYTRP